ncbi:hypothetical protein BOO71_0005296 [Deinococcus marmoris]|uniref:Uncharacterized protein n=1 Tax=Deinococcus marmoris TaxID=249408 RepID=A0A1U7P0C6_9DEIO|nr:hypothetical protein BOO71_0005296 [Deinococcus marmoris]
MSLALPELARLNEFTTANVTCGIIGEMKLSSRPRLPLLPERRI